MKMNTGARSQKPEARSSHPDLRSPISGLQPSQRAVALIITLILLYVVTFMAVTFLTLSRRERGAVTTVTDAAGARYAADAALANAEAQIMANVLASTNPFNFGLLVSTNYINPVGFRPGRSSFTNVNYDHKIFPGGPLGTADFLQNLTNLWYSPRPPVFVTTNSSAPPDFRFYVDLNRNGRFYPNDNETNYDITGAPMFDGSGLLITNRQVGDPEWIGILERPDAPYGPNNKFIARYAFIAVPVGNTLDLNAIHNQVFDEPPSPVPLTTQIHVNPGDNTIDGFFRNQGVGSWEINLAAFLADLNTNQWGQIVGSANWYQYNQPVTANSGHSFEDARALLAYRYADSYNSLARVQNLYPASQSAFKGSIDAYSDGPLMTTLSGTNDFSQSTALPWAGADNTNHFYTHQELFDPAKVAIAVAGISNFPSRLLTAGQGDSTYDRYTFYRLLSQLGTDSTPDSGKMNVNYDNLDPGTNVVATTTNFIPWQPLAFFTNAADRLVRAYTAEWRAGNPTNFAATFYAVSADHFATNFNLFTSDQWTNYPSFGIGKIPILVSNQFVYSSAVNRLLQLAANMFDATTNNAPVMGKNFPSVFRPLFSRDADVFRGTNIFISGYTNVALVVGTNDFRLATPVDISFLAQTNAVFTNLDINVYGVPWIIGAKKGFPNFNKFVLESVVGVTRRLQLTRSTNTSPPTMTGTNQMYLMSLNTSLGLDLWNSYAAQYNGAISGVVRENLSISFTNDETGFNGALLPNIQQPLIFSTNCPLSLNSPINSWPGAGAPLQWYGGSPNANSFIVPLGGTFVMLTNSVYRTRFAASGTVPAGFTVPCLVPTNFLNTFTRTTLLFETNTPGFPLPHWGLLTTNQLQVFMLDLDSFGNYHVIDYAHFEQTSSRDLNAEIFADDLDHNNIGVWNTNINPRTGIPYGIENQIEISRGIRVPLGPPGEDGPWNADPQAASLGGTVTAQQASFQAFFQSLGTVATVSAWSSYPQASASNYLSSVQAPYSPTRYGVGYIIMQANDPLVHYVASDMAPSQLKPGLTNRFNYNQPLPTLTSLDLGQLNANYQPWGGNPSFAPTTWSALTAYNLSLKDPLVRFSDNWDFPTNRLPGIGWLGRVHRGTPWQTVYLKASDLLGVVQIQTNSTPPFTTTNYFGRNIWAQWAGDTQLTYNQYFDAINSAPVQDRLLFDLFTAAFNDNAMHGTLSVNQGAGSSDPASGLAAWSAVFSGTVVLSNNLDNATAAGISHIQYQSPLPGYPAPSYTYMNIQPVGTWTVLTNTALGQIVEGINNTRAAFVNADGLVGSFEHAGDILSVPQFTEQSPFLDVTNKLTGNYIAQLTNGISDEMYEWLPQQTMSLLRCADSPRYVIYCYGQTLKPAPNAIYSGSIGNGAYFGLVTNYQVVSEISTRAVVRFNSTMTNFIGTNTATVYNGTIPNLITNWYSLPAVTNNSAVIESFNILPPDSKQRLKAEG